MKITICSCAFTLTIPLDHGYFVEVFRNRDDYQSPCRIIDCRNLLKRVIVMWEDEIQHEFIEDFVNALDKEWQYSAKGKARQS